MTRTILAALAVLAAGVGSAAAQTDRDGQQRWIDVVNRTNLVIREVYMTDRDTPNWGSDRLGREVVGRGETWRLLPSAQQRARRYCQYDIKVVFENNATVERRGVNLCEATAFVCASPSSCTATR